MARVFVVHSALKIFVLLAFVEQLNFVRGEDGLYNFLEVKMDDFPEKNISAKCLEETRWMKRSLENLTFWAVEMWEATARESPSLLEGTNYHLGNFDECVVPVKRDFKNGPERQYCLVTVNIKFDNPRNFSDKDDIFDPYGSSLNIIYGNGQPSMVERNELFWAVCTPASCSSSDVVMMINNHFEANSDKAKALNISLSASLGEEWCHKDTTQTAYTSGAISFICVLCLLCAIAIAATGYHWYVEYGKTTENKKVQCPDMVKCFSIVFHLNQLNYKGKAEAGLEALNSIRVMAISFVIIGHRVGTITQGPLINREYHEHEYRVMRGAIVRQTDIFVDMFFILSGILAVYHLLKRTEKKSINIGLIILNRYLRLIPLYAMGIYFTATLLPNTGAGPFWKPIMEGEATYCRENWWANILMINNYVNIERMCMLHAWYIPCDFHFFVIAVLMCFILRNIAWRKIGLIILGVLLIISIIIPILITYSMELHASLFFYHKFLVAPRLDPTFQNTYIKSHARFSPYILGMFGGYILYKFHKPGEKRFSRMTSTLGGVSSIIIFLVFLFSTWNIFSVDAEINPILSAIFSGFHRPIKSFLTCLLILFCVFGNIPFISSFLAWRPWMILSKLTYGAYLFHMCLQLRDAAMLRQPFFFDYIFMYFKLSLGDIVASFLLSFLFYITIEGPSNQIIRAVMMPPNTKRKDRPANNSHTNDALELDKQDKV